MVMLLVILRHPGVRSVMGRVGVCRSVGNVEGLGGLIGLAILVGGLDILVDDERSRSVSNAYLGIPGA
jgi:hypothetical protein